jgi:hypothetical protein
MSFSDFIASVRAHYKPRPDEQNGVQIINRLKELLAKHGSSGDLARNA